jgi:carbonic anhydrase
MTDILPGENPITILREGNTRFVQGNPMRPRQDEARRILTAEGGQHPFVAVLACSDSRVPVEILFDQGIGDLFTVRVAGNIAGPSEIGSLEYAVANLGVSALLVLGHTHCGAVHAAVKTQELHGAVGEVIGRILPAVNKATTDHPALTGQELLEAAVRANIRHSMGDLLRNSSIIRDAIGRGKLELIGACYDIRDGLVTWMGPHPAQAELRDAAGA